ncbi:MAG: DUF3418 domain-containing protein, partial [Opitutaceae bacterium]
TPARALTPLGHELARLPVDPIVGRMLLQAVEEKAVREVLVIAAALSIQDPRERPAGAEAAADAAHKRFVHPDSDFLTLLAIWDAFHDKVERLSQGRLRKFCRQHFLNYARMREWRDIRAQLEEALAPNRSPARPALSSVEGEGRDLSPFTLHPSLFFPGERYRAIHRSLLPGLLVNVAHREEGNLFRAGGDRRPLVFPGSALFDRKSRTTPRDKRGGQRPPKHLRNPDWIVAAEIVETARLYARTCAKIDPAWLLELGAHILVVSHSEPAFTVESGRVLARETTRLHGLEVRVRRIDYGKIDPARATEIFIREGLLNDGLTLPHRFLEHNRRLRDKAEVLRTRMRSGQYLDLDEAIYQFYQYRLEGVSSVHDLNRVIRERSAREPQFLFMREEHLLGNLPEDFGRGAFPDEVTLENSALPLHYAYKPGQKTDGVTLQLAPSHARALSPGMLDWLVPGHLEEKILLLLRGLPKDIRRQLIPIPEKAAAMARELRPTHATLVESLAAHLEKHFRIRTFPSDWKPEELPDHLRVRVEVVDAGRNPIAASRDLDRVRELLEEQEREAARRPNKDVSDAWIHTASLWERTGLETWTFDELPDSIVVADAGGLTIHAYPGLRLEKDGVALRLFKTPEESRRDLAAALEKFFEHELRYELGWLDRDLKEVARLGPLAVTLVPIAELKQNVREHLRRHLCARLVKPLTREAFNTAAEAARSESKGLLYRLADQLEAVLKIRQELLVQMPTYKDAAKDLDRLIPNDFPRRECQARLKHLPRYLYAMQARGRKTRENPARDAERARTLAQLEQKIAMFDKAGRLTPAAREELAWMLEELRVSLFAQELGTAFPISEKRIEKRLTELTA